MRPSRLLYVENDPALRGVMTRLLSAHSDIELLISVESPDEALSSPEVARADVALLDLALGPNVMNGIDLGLALREQTPSHFKLAGTIGRTNLRSLDALHVATAVAASCTAMATLDARVAEASESVGIPVLDIKRPVERVG